MLLLPFPYPLMNLLPTKLPPPGFPQISSVHFVYSFLVRFSDVLLLLFLSSY